MNQLYQQYVNNLNTVHGLAKPTLSPGMDQREILSRIREDAHHTYMLRRENDQLLERFLFSLQPEELSDEEIGELKDLAAKLASFSRSLDTGIAYRIHQLLYRCAQERGDRALSIRELYYQGLCSYYMSMSDASAGINLFVDKVGEYFDAGAAYLDEYEDIPDSETRGYIIRCLANRRLGPGVKGKHHPLIPDAESRYPKYKRYFKQAMDVIQSPRYRAMDPNLPWDSYEYAMHYDRTTYLTELRSHPDQPELARDVLESAQFAYKYQSRAKQLSDRTASTRTQYIYDAARYHAGIISVRELVDLLFDVYDRADPCDFSAQGIFNNFRIPLYIYAYSKSMSDGERDAYRDRVEHCGHAMLQYLMDFPRGEYASLVSSYLAGGVSYYAGDRLPIQEHLLHFILACHPPTYVHSRMVAWITRHFFEHMVKHAPEMLVGAFGIQSAQEAVERREELCQRAYICGLYHDAGKSMMLDVVGIYGRRLLDEEFEKIKLHPLLSFHLLKNYPDLDIPAQVALRHHRAWNGKGGYPTQVPPCPPEALLPLAVVTIADAMDAATDDVGRSYAEAKSFQKLVLELREGSGTRYAPRVVALLDDPELFNSLSARLEKERQRIYCDIHMDQNQEVSYAQ